jgi:tetratricopeptide (TPR) repeat protein
MSKQIKKEPASSGKRKEPTSKGKKPARPGFFQRNSFAVVLFLLTFVVFGNGIFNEYALDDEFYTNSAEGGNKLTAQGVKGIPKIFKTRAFFNNDGSGYSYRPVALTSFALEAELFGEHPHISHFINVLLYALTMVLLFQLLRRWFSTVGDWFTFFICLIFLVHPIHTEVVDNIKCRDELLAFLFTILTMLYIWKHHETRKWQYLVLFPLCFLAGLLCKRTVVPFLALIPLAMWFFMDINWKKILLYFAPLFLMLAVSALMQKVLLTNASRTYQAFENPLPSNSDFFELTATSFYILGRYLQLLFVPHPLVYYYGYRYVPLVDWSNWIAITSLIIHAALGIYALMGLRKKTILSFALLFYLVNIAAYSNLLQAAPGLMAERFAYSASLGFCIAVVLLVFRAFKLNPEGFRWKLDTYKPVRFALILLALVFTVRSWVRNEDWEDKLTLYSHDIEYISESAKGNMLLGSLNSSRALRMRLEARTLSGQGNQAAAQQKIRESDMIFEESRNCFKKAAEVAPYYHTAWSNLGTTYFFVGEAREAIPYFKKAVEIKPDYAEGLFNLGMSYDTLHMVDSAIYYFRGCIAADSGWVPAYEQLSDLMARHKKDPYGALDLLHIAARKKPNSDSPWNTMSKIYLAMGDTVSGAGALEMAAQINPHNMQRLYKLSEYYRRHGDMIKSNQYRAMLEEEQKKQQQDPQQQGQQQRGRRQR